MKEESENIIDLGYHRQRMFPTKEEVEAHLSEVSKNAESLGEAEVAGALLILFRDGEIEATRGKEGQFLYALRKEESHESGRLGSVQSISTASGYNRVVENLCQESSSDLDSE